MSTPLTIAVLTANPALTALLAAGLEEQSFRVPRFESAMALLTFLRVSPVDVVVLDGEMGGPSAIELARTLRRHPRLASPLFEIVALTRTRAEFQRPFRLAGIDLVLDKPIHPSRLAAELRAHLAETRAPARHGRRRPDLRRQRLVRLPLRPRQRHDNVVDLFGTFDR